MDGHQRGTLFGKRPIGTVTYLGGVWATPEAFTWSWSQMIAFNFDYVCKPNETIHYIRAPVSDHGPARNWIVSHAKGDWVLMLDTDHSFEPDLCARMLHRINTFSIDVLTGLYRQKEPPYGPMIYRLPDKSDDGRKDGFQVISAWDSKAQLIPVDSAGAGCLMVRRSVFHRIRDELHEKPFDRLEDLSEDHSFFVRLKRLGIEAWCDTRIECWHLRAQRVTDGEANREYQAIQVRGLIG